MKKNLIQEITKKASVTEKGLRVMLSKIKGRYDLTSIEQAACYYIKKNNLNINVSSVIDDVTRQAIRSNQIQKPILSQKPRPNKRTRSFAVPKIKWVSPSVYSLAERLSEFYPYLFIFENALRLRIDTIMRVKNPDWWEVIIKRELPEVYKYAKDEEARQAILPMVGHSDALKPIDYITVGLLEQIIVKYQKDFIPSCFPKLHFFNGHMMIVKRVRNAIAHMAPSTTKIDIRNAKGEIDILLQHLSTVN